MDVLLRVDGEGEGPWSPGDWLLWDVVDAERSILVQVGVSGYALPPSYIPHLIRDLFSGSVQVARLSPPVRRLVVEALSSDSRFSPVLQASIPHLRLLG